MKKHLLFVASLAMVAGLSACKTVTFNAPEGAVISYEGETLGTGTGSIKVNIIEEKKVVIEKTGYAKKVVNVTLASPKTIQVKLNRIFSVASKPSDAEIYVNGLNVGTTPAKQISIDESVGEITVEVRKKGYVPEKKVIDAKSASELSFTLSKDGPGRHLPIIVPNAEGVDVQFSDIAFDRNTLEQSPAVTDCKRVTNLLKDDYLLDFCLMPGGKDLVISIMKEKEKDDVMEYRANLWQLSLAEEGTEPSALTSESIFFITPSPSADGSSIYFSSTRNGRLGLYSMKLSNKSMRRIDTAGNTADATPVMNPKSEQLLYSAIVPESSSPAYVWSKTGNGTPTNLVEGYNPQWSPDGTKILFVKGSVEDNEARIWVCDAEGGNAKQLTKGEGDFNDIDASWSADGKKIVFSSSRSEVNDIHNYDIYIMNADGSDIKQLTTNSSRDDSPVLAADGKTVFFRSNRGLIWDIWSMKIK